MGADNNGGSTDYYKLPSNSIDLQDLIEFKQMNFSQANIFKAIYRGGNQDHSDYERDLNKIIWFANRELKRVGNKDIIDLSKIKYKLTRRLISSKTIFSHSIQLCATYDGVEYKSIAFPIIIQNLRSRVKQLEEDILKQIKNK